MNRVEAEQTEDILPLKNSEYNVSLPLCIAESLVEYTTQDPSFSKEPRHKRSQRLQNSRSRVLKRHTQQVLFCIEDRQRAIHFLIHDEYNQQRQQNGSVSGAENAHVKESVYPERRVQRVYMIEYQEAQSVDIVVTQEYVRRFLFLFLIMDLNFETSETMWVPAMLPRTFYNKFDRFP
jgi:hypothetical protein